MSEPVRERPIFPPSYAVPQSEEGMLPWEFAQEQLEQAKNFWICTVGPQNKPHARPLWGVWLEGRLFFEGGPTTRWARNLRANPQASMHLESGDKTVIVEGLVEDIDDVGQELYERVTAIFGTKYNYKPEDHGFYVLVPRIVLAWNGFPKTPTRWRFPASAQF